MDSLASRLVHVITSPGKHPMTSEFFQRLEPRTFLSAGALDPSFGVFITDQHQVAIQTVAAVSLQSGKTLVMGTAYTSANTFGLALFDSTGRPDTSFGDQGVIVEDFAFVGPSSLGVDHAGRIYVGGGEGIVRLNSSGALDKTFAQEGFFRFGRDRGRIFSLLALAIGGDGKIVAGGTDEIGNDPRKFVVARLNENGTFDRSFGFRGRTSAASVSSAGTDAHAPHCASCSLRLQSVWVSPGICRTDR